MYFFKLNAAGNIRRLSLERKVPYSELRKKIAALYAIHEAGFDLKYLDDESDLVSLSSDIELDEALRQAEAKESKMIRVEINEHSGSIVRLPKAVIAKKQEAERKLAVSLPEPVIDPEPVAEEEEKLKEEEAPEVITEPEAELSTLKKLEKKLGRVLKSLGEFLDDVKNSSVDTYRKFTEKNERQIVPTSSQPSFLDMQILSLKRLAEQASRSVQQELARFKAEIVSLKNKIKKEMKKLGQSQQARKEAGKFYFSPLLGLQSLNINENVPLLPAPEAQPEEAPEAQPEPEHESEEAPPYGEELLRLQEMGFTDKDKNLALLVAHNGDLARCIADLL